LDLETYKSGVIVLGGHVQGYGIVRIFGENNIPCIVIDTTKINIARHSKYCLKFYKINYRNLIGLLLEFAKNSKFKNWLLIPTDDYYVRLLSQNRDKLNNHFIVTVDDWERINIFFNKKNTYLLAQKIGIPIPKTFYPSSIEAIKSFRDVIKFPCIIKPAIMLDFYRHFKQKVFVCNDITELEVNFKKAVEIVKPEEVIVQEIIPGNNENQYSVGIFFDRDKSYNLLVGRRKRQHPIDFGNATTFAETVDIPILIEYAEKILTEAKFFGICEVEFKYDQRDNQYKFLEVNPRTWKWHVISQFADIPFLLSLYNYFLAGRPIIKKDYENSGWRDIVTDLPIIFKLLLKGIFIKSDATNIQSAVFNKADLKPFLYQLIFLPYLIIKR